VPFYRSMAAGDVFYLAVIFGCWALADARLPSLQQARSASCNHVLGDCDREDTRPGNSPSSARLVRLH
jgi:hypothetical protein